MRASRVTMLCLLALALLALPGAANAQSTCSTPLDAPILSCAGSGANFIDVRVCGGASGAPAGFTLGWISSEEIALGPDGIDGTPDDGTYVHTQMCRVRYSAAEYLLDPEECVTIRIGGGNPPPCACDCPAELDCNQTWIFHAYSNTYGERCAGWTDDMSCSTEPCEEGCSYTIGYWKTHGPVPTGNNSNEWPVSSLQLGDVTYTALELLAIFNEPVQGNGLVSLAHQLIGAKLNIAAGADDSAIAATITAADALIGDMVVPPVGSGFISPQYTSALNEALTDFNEGFTGPGHCTDDVILY